MPVCACDAALRASRTIGPRLKSRHSREKLCLLGCETLEIWNQAPAIVGCKFFDVHLQRAAPASTRPSPLPVLHSAAIGWSKPQFFQCSAASLLVSPRERHSEYKGERCGMLV